jgi:hypothetical protein
MCTRVLRALNALVSVRARRSLGVFKQVSCYRLIIRATLGGIFTSPVPLPSLLLPLPLPPSLKYRRLARNLVARVIPRRGMSAAASKIGGNRKIEGRKFGRRVRALPGRRTRITQLGMNSAPERGAMFRGSESPLPIDHRAYVRTAPAIIGNPSKRFGGAEGQGGRECRHSAPHSASPRCARIVSAANAETREASATRPQGRS